MLGTDGHAIAVDRNVRGTPYPQLSMAELRRWLLPPEDRLEQAGRDLKDRVRAHGAPLIKLLASWDLCAAPSTAASGGSASSGSAAANGECGNTTVRRGRSVFGEGVVGAQALLRAMGELGFDAPLSQAAVKAFFAEIDPDVPNPSTIRLAELNRFLHRKIHPRVHLLRHLKESVRASSARIVDTFRAWDTDDDALISAEEMARALSDLGFETSRREARRLFREIDADRSEQISFVELQAWLAGPQGSATSAGAAILAAAAAGASGVGAAVVAAAHPGASTASSPSPSAILVASSPGGSPAGASASSPMAKLRKNKNVLDPAARLSGARPAGKGKGPASRGGWQPPPLQESAGLAACDAAGNAGPDSKPVSLPASPTKPTLLTAPWATSTAVGAPGEAPSVAVVNRTSGATGGDTAGAGADAAGASESTLIGAPRSADEAAVSVSSPPRLASRSSGASVTPTPTMPAVPAVTSAAATPVPLAPSVPGAPGTTPGTRTTPFGRARGTTPPPCNRSKARPSSAGRLTREWQPAPKQGTRRPPGAVTVSTAATRAGVAPAVTASAPKLPLRAAASSRGALTGGAQHRRAPRPASASVASPFLRGNGSPQRFPVGRLAMLGLNANTGQIGVFLAQPSRRMRALPVVPKVPTPTTPKSWASGSSQAAAWAVGNVVRDGPYTRH